MIPQIIFSTWKSKTDLGNFTEYVKSVKKENPDFEYIIYDDADCDLFVKTYYPYYYKYYKKLELPVQKADLWRYLIIYHYGGWYSDMDIYAYSAFSSIKIPEISDDLLIVEQEFPGPLKTNFYRDIQYAQYWFAATPKHPVLWEIIQKVIYNIQSEIYSKEMGDEYTLYLTGPVPFTQSILEYGKENVYILEPNIWDTLCHGILYKISSFLGNYKNIPVVHICEGSWRITNINYNGIIFAVISIIIITILIIYIKLK